MKKNEAENTIPELETKSGPKIYAPVEVRPMKRSVLKELREAGLDLNFESNIEMVQKTILMSEFIMDKVYFDDKRVDELEEHQIIALASDTFIRAYRGPASIKN